MSNNSEQENVGDYREYSKVLYDLVSDLLRVIRAKNDNEKDIAKLYIQRSIKPLLEKQNSFPERYGTWVVDSFDEDLNIGRRNDLIRNYVPDFEQGTNLKK